MRRNTGFLLVLLLLTPSAWASEFSGNVAYTTDYRFRGISQGDRSPAIQGGFDLSFESGAYIGTWASNVTFGGASIEMDYYVGYAFEPTEDLALDFGLIYYNYPEDDADPDFDYLEAYASVNWEQLTLGVAVSNDYFAETDTFYYLYGAYEIPLGEAWTLSINAGLNQFDDDDAFAAFIGPAVGVDAGDNYVDYGVTVSKSHYGLDWSLAAIGTNLDEDECFADTKLCQDTIVLTVAKSF